VRIVIDTNVLVSAFLYDGVPLEVISLAESGAIEVATSNEAITELLAVLSRHRFSQRLRSLGLSASAIVRRYREIAIVIDLVDPPKICSDPDDDMFIGIAVAAKADMIVSGDRHLLEITDISPAPIVTPSEFLSVLSKTSEA
jgi:uncharacterized protein